MRNPPIAAFFNDQQLHYQITKTTISRKNSHFFANMSHLTATDFKSDTTVGIASKFPFFPAPETSNVTFSSLKHMQQKLVTFLNSTKFGITPQGMLAPRVVPRAFFHH